MLHQKSNLRLNMKSNLKNYYIFFGHKMKCTRLDRVIDRAILKTNEKEPKLMNIPNENIRQTRAYNLSVILNDPKIKCSRVGEFEIDRGPYFPCSY